MLFMRILPEEHTVSVESSREIRGPNLELVTCVSWCVRLVRGIVHLPGQYAWFFFVHVPFGNGAPTKLRVDRRHNVDVEQQSGDETTEHDHGQGVQDFVPRNVAKESKGQDCLTGYDG